MIEQAVEKRILKLQEKLDKAKQDVEVLTKAIQILNENPEYAILWEAMYH